MVKLIENIISNTLVHKHNEKVENIKRTFNGKIDRKYYK